MSKDNRGNALTKTEQKIVDTLRSRGGNCCGYDELIDNYVELPEFSQNKARRSLSVRIHNIKSKIEDGALIDTVRSKGYIYKIEQ